MIWLSLIYDFFIVQQENQYIRKTYAKQSPESNYNISLAPNTVVCTCPCKTAKFDFVKYHPEEFHENKRSTDMFTCTTIFFSVLLHVQLNIKL